MVNFEVHMNSKISKGMIHYNVQVMFHETMWDINLFLNNVGFAITEIIWNCDHKFMDPNNVTTSIRITIRAFYDIYYLNYDSVNSKCKFELSLINCYRNLFFSFVKVVDLGRACF
jgi:hypothetical protein